MFTNEVIKYINIPLTRAGVPIMMFITCTCKTDISVNE